MIPLKDSIPSRHTPVVNYAIVAICSLAFFAQSFSGDGGNRIIEQYGMVPARLSDPSAELIIEQPIAIQTGRGVEIRVVDRELAPAAIPPWLTVISCMFLHGGWMHFLGNMWFLYIFGDNVEDRLGHVGYALMYLGTGMVAGMAHYAAGPESPIPTIGASGAIAGVMGAYAWLFPHSRVLAVLPLLIVMPTFVLPAPVFLLIWFAMQTLSGIMASASGVGGGVAWWGHIGGFVAGAAVAVVLGRGHRYEEGELEHRF